MLSSSNSFCCSRCCPKHNHASGWSIWWEKQIFERNIVGAFLGSSVTLHRAEAPLQCHPMFVLVWVNPQILKEDLLWVMLDPHKCLQSYPASNHTRQIYFAFNCGCFPCPLLELLSSLPLARVCLWLCRAHRITEITGFSAWILCAAIYVISAKTFPIY